MHTVDAPTEPAAYKTEPSYENDKIKVLFFAASMSQMLRLHQIFNCLILGLISHGTRYFVRNNSIIVSRSGRPIFGAKLPGDTNWFHNFHSLKPGIVFKIINSSFHLQYDKLSNFNTFPNNVQLFPRAASLLVNSNFRRTGRMQG